MKLDPDKVILAKPTGVTYEQHINNVVDQAELYLKHHPFVVQRYQTDIGKSLEDYLLKAAKFHDIGKRDKRWQQACINDYKEYIRTKDKSRFRATYLQKLGRQKIRHELIPLKELRRKLDLPLEILIAIAAHHGKLKQSEEDRFKNSGAGEIWKDLLRLDGELDTIYPNEKSLEKVLKYNYQFSGPRYLLQLADHRGSASEPPDNIELPPYDKFEYKFPKKWEKRPVQKLAEKNWQDPLLLLRAPTGSGKTDAALLWAKKQVENGKADRLVICMPTRFTSNALEIAVADQLSSTGLYHSSAWYTKHSKEAKKSKDTLQREKQKHTFARTLEVPVTVCTIDHLLISLTLSREDHHGIFFNLVHSCVVIDEADFYDDFTQANIQVLLRVLKILGVPVLVMSATLPKSAIKLYQEAGYDDLAIKEDSSDNQRIRCEIKACIPYSIPDDIKYLLEKCMKQPSIIYANTVDKAYAFYRWFDKKGYKDITLYHSRYTEPDKESKEAELIAKLGKDAWANNTAHGVAILTQIGELSVNISADLMLSDLAPGDRLVQRFGRLSRFKKDYGIVYLLIPQKNDELYPAPYGDFTIPKWKPSPYLVKTKKLFKPGKYNSADFINLINKIYPEQPEKSILAVDNAQQLLKYLHSRWLILPAEKVEEDDEGTMHWKSRNIPPNQELFVNELKTFFSSYTKLLEYKLESSVSLPGYIIEKAVRGNLVSKHRIMIDDVEASIFFDANNNYDQRKGMILDYDEYDDQFL